MHFTRKNSRKAGRHPKAFVTTQFNVLIRSVWGRIIGPHFLLIHINYKVHVFNVIIDHSGPIEKGTLK